jgi:hypothetical protein
MSADKAKTVFYCHTSPIEEDYFVDVVSEEVSVTANFGEAVAPSLYSQGKISLQDGDEKEAWDLTLVDEVQLEVWYQFHRTSGKRW